MTTQQATMNKPKAPAKVSKNLSAKDIVLLAVFGAVTFFIFIACSMVFSFSTDLAWWTHAVGSIPGGILWAYTMARVPKRGGAVIAGGVMALLGLMLGMLWTGPVGMLIGAILCEVIMTAGKRSKWSMAIGFAVFVLCWWFGQISLIIFTGEAYVQMIIDMGMTADYGWGLINWVASPMFPLCGVVTILCSLAGCWLGIALFKKHFAKING